MRHLIVAASLAALVCVLGPWSTTAAQNDEPTYEGKTVSEWLQILDDPEMSKEAYAALSYFDAEAIPAFINALSDDSRIVRGIAAELLAPFGTKAKAGVPALTRALKDDDDWVRQCAAQALGSIGPDAKTALPTLCDRLKNDAEPSVREAATGAIADIGPDPKMIPLLVEALDDQKTGVRLNAARALGALGPKGKAAVPDLAEALTDENEYVVKFVWQALAKIGKASVPALVEALEDQRWEVREAAANALGTIGPDANAALEPLKKALEKETVDAPRMEIESAIASIERDE